MTRRQPATAADRLARGMAEAIEVGECLEWQGPYSCKGVTPCVKVRDPSKNPSTRSSENVSVPRLLWERERGPVPAGRLVYRVCCNNACVLFAHLRCGTRAQWHKARKKAGASLHKPATRLALTLAARRRANVSNSMEKARAVRSLAASGARDAAIAAEVGMSIYMVADVRRGDAWRELGGSLFGGLAA